MFPPTHEESFVTRGIRNLIAVAALAVATVAVTAGPATARTDVKPATTAAITASTPCGAVATPPATYKHVITIVEENHSYNQIIGSSQAPYENSLAKSCGLATNFYAESYPSLPNYTAMTSGQIPASIANKDCLPSGPCVSSVPSIFSQVPSWRVYGESAPANCSRQNTSNGLYVPRHTAAPYYTGLNSACSSMSLPLGTTSGGALLTALNTGTLPAYSFIAPNTTNDMHGGCVTCGDAWLKTWMPKILASSAYQSGTTAIFVTFDSDNKSAGNHIMTILVAPSVKPGTTSSTRFDHYSMLHTQEQMLGISTFLGKAATAASMRSAFNF
jgi:phospholipase C